MDNLVFYQSPEVTLATNVFINVPTILQYEDTPLVEVVRVEKAGFAVQIPIFHPDGTYIAKAVGSRLFTTKDGEKAGLNLTYHLNRTVCELDGRTLFEIQRTGSAAIKAYAELYTPDGAFVKCHPDLYPQLFLDHNETPLRVAGLTLQGNIFQNLKIGVWIRKNGTLNIGVG